MTRENKNLEGEHFMRKAFWTGYALGTCSGFILSLTILIPLLFALLS